MATDSIWAEDTTQRPPPVRLILRTMTREVLNALAAQADAFDMDLVTLLVFTGVWTANTEHLNDAQYIALFDLPPDFHRRPITLRALAGKLRMPLSLVQDRIAQLQSAGLVDQGERGIVVPTGVFTKPEMIAAVEAQYERSKRLVETMGALGLG